MGEKNFIYFDNIIKQDSSFKAKSVNTDSLHHTDSLVKLKNYLPINKLQKTQNISKIDSAQLSAKYRYLNIKSTNPTIVEDYRTVTGFESYDGSYYSLAKPVSRLYKKNEVLKKLSVEKEISRCLSIAPKDKVSNSTDWYFIPILAGIITLAFIIGLYQKYITQLYESVAFRFVSKKLINDKNQTLKRFGVILDILFIISFSLLIDQILVKLNLYSPPQKFKFITALMFSVFLLILRILRFLVFKLTKFLTDESTFIKDLYINSLIYTRLISIILLPLMFLAVYSSIKISLILIYFSIFILLIALIFRLIRSVKVFLDNDLSIFYFILYLCALEIAPLLVFWKEVQTRIN